MMVGPAGFEPTT